MCRPSTVSLERGSNDALPPPTAPSISAGWGPKGLCGEEEVGRSVFQGHTVTCEASSSLCHQMSLRISLIHDSGSIIRTFLNLWGFFILRWSSQKTLAWNIQTHNSLCISIYTYGSGVEPIHGIVCRTRGHQANQSCVCRVGAGFRP